MHLQHLRHPNVVALYGIALTKTKGIVVMELCEGRDLHSALQVTAAGSTERLFSWGRRGRRVALEVARALNYLHSRGMVHMDVKSANILLTVGGTGERLLREACMGAAAGNMQGGSTGSRGLHSRWSCAGRPTCAALSSHATACLLCTRAAKLADVAFSRHKVHTFFSGSVPVVGTFAW